jgi:hypothetical protein
MRDGFIFWEQPLRVTGPGSPASTLANIQAQVSVGRFGGTERLSGKIEGHHIRVWRKAAVAASDVVQFEGAVRPFDGGVVVEGRLNYTVATRLQFSGCLALGVALLAGGAIDRLSGSTPGADILGVGAFISIVSMIWIYSSSRMRGMQIDFIDSRLKDAAASATPQP